MGIWPIRRPVFSPTPLIGHFRIGENRAVKEQAACSANAGQQSFIDRRAAGNIIERGGVRRGDLQANRIASFGAEALPLRGIFQIKRDLSRHRKRLDGSLLARLCLEALANYERRAAYNIGGEHIEDAVLRQHRKHAVCRV